MADHETKAGIDAARAMLDAFTSVGAESFHLTLTSRQGRKLERNGFRKSVPANVLREILPAELTEAAQRQHNVIVRPNGPPVFIQLDDLDQTGLQRVQPAAFLSLQTSPGNYQAWVALRETDDKDFARRLRKGAGADDTASGATRVAGSLNFKEKYAPNYPRVEVAHTSPGRFATKEQLRALGIVAAPEVVAPSPVLLPRPWLATKKWPNYGICVRGAPLNREKTGPDVSRADFTWCMTALDWGWSIEETAARLITESSKAKENGEGYALLTAQNAAAAVTRRRESRGIA